MIAKNKHSPATLYLLNGKSSTQRQQEERKSARLTFNKKKSARSISQYHKWNPSQNKQPANNNNNINLNVNNGNMNNNISGINQGQFYQPSSRTNSQIKKIVLTQNRFGLQPMPLQKKLSSIIEIFKPNNKSYHQSTSKRVSTLTCQPINQNKVSKKTQQSAKSGQLSLLSLKQINQKQHPNKHSQSRGKISTHRRTQSMLNHADQQRNNKNKNSIENKNLSFENIVAKVERKFKAYEKHSEDWKLKYSSQEIDYLIDDMLRVFKGVFNELTSDFSSYMTSNLDVYQTSIMDVVKDYEMQIFMLRDQINKKNQASFIIESLLWDLNEKHYKAQVCSKIFEDIQLHGTDLEHYVKTSSLNEEIRNLAEEIKQYKKYNNQSQIPYDFNLSSMAIPCQKDTSNLNMAHSDDDDFYEEEKHDYVEQDSNWNDHFQNRESIKGVLKYINNHKENQLLEKNNSKNNLNSTGYLLAKDKNDMKIDNWKSFEDKSISQYKKIMSQR